MNVVRLSFKNIAARPLASGLSLLLLTLGTGLISLVMLVNKQVEGQLLNNVRGIDMVVGAKGSPLQLILSSVLHMDAPTGNIALSEAEKLQKNPLVAQSIPLSYGDTYKGYRIVGTTANYPELYSAQLEQGNFWSGSMEVTAGAAAAKALGLSTGSTFAGNHGLDAHGHAHEEHPYTVVGVLKPTGTVLDQLLLTAPESVWHVHGSHDGPKEITAMLVRFKSPMGIMRIPREVNQHTNMQAALPVYELNRLMDLLGVGIDMLKAIALAIMLVSGLSVFVSLFSALRDRIGEMALMRTWGASGGQLFTLVLLEGLLLSLGGLVLGLVVSRLGMLAIAAFAEDAYKYQLNTFELLPTEGLLALAALGIGALAALLPALRAMRVDISDTLRNG